MTCPVETTLAVIHGRWKVPTRTFASSWVACVLYGVVAAIWFVPDRRIEREIESGQA